MSESLHLNLITDEERFSSSPVRLRVMVPILAVLTVLGLAVWWLLFAFRLYATTTQKAALSANIAGLATAHKEVMGLRAQEKEYSAQLRQLSFYRNSRIRFGGTFALLAERVPETLQITELCVPPPPPLPPSPVDPTKKPALGPTNLFETVALRLAGRASGQRPTEAVNTLLEALRTPAFTNLILSAEIPKGAFRQDTGKDSAAREALLFEITCGCAPRRFE